MTEAFIGLLGILIGLLINEHFRRTNRIEKYSSHIFDKRLEIYEKLMHLVNEKSSLVMDIIENNQLSKEEANKICHSAGFEIMEYCDANWLYLNEEIIVHIATTFIGVDDIIESDNEGFKKKEKQEFRKSIVSAKTND